MKNKPGLFDDWKIGAIAGIIMCVYLAVTFVLPLVIYQLLMELFGRLEWNYTWSVVIAVFLSVTWCVAFIGGAAALLKRQED